MLQQDAASHETPSVTREASHPSLTDVNTAPRILQAEPNTDHAKARRNTRDEGPILETTRREQKSNGRTAPRNEQVYHLSRVSSYRASQIRNASPNSHISTSRSKAPRAEEADHHLLLPAETASQLPVRFPGKPLRVSVLGAEGGLAMPTLPNSFCRRRFTTLPQECHLAITRSGKRNKGVIPQLGSLSTPFQYRSKWDSFHDFLRLLYLHLSHENTVMYTQPNEIMIQFCLSCLIVLLG